MLPSSAERATGSSKWPPSNSAAGADGHRSTVLVGATLSRAVAAAERQALDRETMAIRRRHMSVSVSIRAAGLFVVVLYAQALFAYSALISAEKLLAGSDVVVLAEIIDVRIYFGPPQELRVATARVLETWKGNTRESHFDFVASPGWFACDTSDARKGERVVLFLHREEGQEYPVITNFGRGRMRIGTIDGVAAASVFEVTFPSEVRMLRERHHPRGEAVSLQDLRTFVQQRVARSAV